MAVGSYQKFGRHAQAERAAAQAVRRIVRPKPVLLGVQTEEKLGLQIAALDPKARHHLHRRFGADHALAAETAGVVAVEPAREQHLQEKAVLLEAAGRHQQAAMGEGAVAPDVAAGKQKDARLVVVGGPTGAGRYTKPTSNEGRGGECRRAYAPPRLIEAPEPRNGPAVTHRDTRTT